VEKQGLAHRLTQYGDQEFALFLRRSFARSMGFSEHALGKPIIGIVNTYSELNNCHGDSANWRKRSSAACGRRAGCRSNFR